MCIRDRSCVLVKQSLGPLHCGLLLHKHSLSLTYGVILPSSLATVLSLTSGSSPCPPVSVLVRAAMGLIAQKLFLEADLTCFVTCRNVHLPITSCISYAHFTTYLLLRFAHNPFSGSCQPSPSFLHFPSRVQEYLPVFHPLRLSASRQVPTYPGRTNLPLESLGYRLSLIHIFLRGQRKSRYPVHPDLLQFPKSFLPSLKYDLD